MSEFQHSFPFEAANALAKNAISARELSKPLIIWDLFSNSQNVEELVYESPPRIVGGRMKRAFDVSAAALLLTTIFPVLLVIAAVVRLTSAGPAIFIQERSGIGARMFQIYKFRTMIAADAVPGVKQAKREDPRLTPVGGFLRKTSLDELPQLINVLKGDMSLVGPRPHALSHDKVFAAHNARYRRRFTARPGITGLAQVSGARGRIVDVHDLAKRVNLDLNYIEDWSLRSDIGIIIKTVRLMWGDENAY